MVEQKQEQQELDLRQEIAGLPTVGEQVRKLRKLRYGIDRFAKAAISLGGIGIIATLLLIFIYLLQEVIPLFRSATIDERSSFQLTETSASETLYLGIEEQASVGVRLDGSGEFSFFDLDSGSSLSQQQLALSAPISSFASDSTESGLMAFGLENGNILVVDQEYNTSFDPADNTRIITPTFEFPFGESALEGFQSRAVTDVAIASRGEEILVAATNSAGNVVLIKGERQRSLLSAFDPEANQSFTVQRQEVGVIAGGAQRLLIDGDLRLLLTIGSSGNTAVFGIESLFRDGTIEEMARADLLPSDERLVDARFLLGGVSLLVSSNSGVTTQWFLIRDESGNRLQAVRSFSSTRNSITTVSSELRRKNFITTDESGVVRIFNTTASKAVLEESILPEAAVAVGIAPRGNALIAESSAGNITIWEIDNPHPEISWSALWEKVWYEGYPEPDFIWQSSAASNDFEPKYSLTPLTFGTFKAALYAMVLAAPLAVCGAIYTGYFMAPRLRRKIKPTVELMEALPTVVLGFLAGLWLAPLVEQHLLAVFSVIVLLPLSILAASLLWMFIPKSVSENLPDGWEAIFLIPVVLLFGWLSFALAAPIENVFFDGDLRNWLSNEMGISYDQRNAMVVGLAMGFAVIPTIFSIAEDAIFNVPQQLSYGSLALGATPWQSLYRVVLPTASPGIFSALMVGMGRAIGETMIVLMATGNTPIMDINLFEGMRTLAANIAVEIPESEVGSSHYRILFLAALVLFVFTFMVNTVAEVVRQRLRSRYNVL